MIIFQPINFSKAVNVFGKTNHIIKKGLYKSLFLVFVTVTPKNVKYSVYILSVLLYNGYDYNKLFRGEIAMKKKLKKLIGVAIPTVAVALGLRKAYTDFRYGEKTAKSTFKFSEIADGNTEGVHLTAHRGLSSVAPENSFEAFMEATKYPFYAIECDVHCTTDNKWVIIHDHMIQSMTDEKGDVRKLSYEDDLSKIKYTNGANINKYPNASFCLVEEYLEVCKKANIKPMIEVKDRRTEKVESLFNIIKAYDLCDDVILISFHSNILREFRRLCPQMTLWYLMHNITDERLLECVENNNGVAFEAKRAMKAPEMIQKIHDNGLTAAVWTVDTPEELNFMLRHNVKYITTNTILPL